MPVYLLYDRETWVWVVGWGGGGGEVSTVGGIKCMTRPLCSENWAIFCGRANVSGPIEPLQLRSFKKKET
jgi:hypothetical protein